ncbi:Uncharacterised protein [Enterobacter cancerogenus]|uniref:Uncharacterized protein n=1 Tax=Enterobacter cancerogenus TaxID=69218 RepID=A0A484Z313_9ENTR|nr:Uncharacterised protein [Enterobacter cancerogenus]
MRMLKCYLGNNRDGHVVTAKDAMQSPGRIMDLYFLRLSVDTSCGFHLVRPPGLNMTREQ